MNCPECGSVRIIVHDVRKQITRKGPGKEGRLEIDFLIGNVIVRSKRCLNKDCRAEFYTVEKIVKILS